MIWTRNLITLLFAAGQTQVLALQKSDHAGQAALADEQSWKGTNSHKLAPTMTVNVEGSATATYEPEVACLDIRVSAQNETEQSARAAWKAAADGVSELLKENPSVAEWERFPERLHNDDEKLPGRFRSKDDEKTEPTVSSQFTGRVESPDMVSILAKDLTKIDHVSISWVRWVLSEETKALAKMAAKESAIRDCLDAGQRYVDVLGYSTMELVGIDEQYTFFEESDRSYRGYYFEDGPDVEPQMVQGETHVKCSIRLF